MELSGCNIKIFLIFSQKKTFRTFREMENPKKFILFQETEHSYISRNETLKKLLIFQEVTFRARKMEKKLKKTSCPKLKKTSKISGRNLQSLKNKQKICSDKISCLLRRFCDL